MLNIQDNPAQLLQRLLQFDTTNPPGNEVECIAYIGSLLKEAGVPFEILALDPKRPNLVARLPGLGQAPPLLMYGHVDVVTTENQQWQHPPFSGDLADGFIWGRGALDMKAGVAMMLSAFLRTKSFGLELPGDLIFCALSDEEAGGDFGARFMVEEHPEQFEGVQYAIGEFGGFTQSIGGKRFYMIQVAEKQICWLKTCLRGQGGHGSLPVRGGAMAQLARLLSILDKHPLPLHVTPVAKQMFSAIANHLPGMKRLALHQLTNQFLSGLALTLIGEAGNVFAPMLHNTVSPTMLQASSKINVIPNEVSLELDGRLLPGFTPIDMLKELRKIVGEGVEFEVVRYDPGPEEPNMGFFDQLAETLTELDPSAVIVPLLLSGVTDGRHFSRLGIQSYGFLPMQLPEGFNFSRTLHAVDERIPVEALNFGTTAISKALLRHGKS